MPNVRHAASIIITRGTKLDLKVFLVQRNPELRFMGSFWAFPGGTIIQEDHISGGEGPELALVRCALRELFLKEDNICRRQQESWLINQ